MSPALGAKQGGLLLEGEADMAVGRQAGCGGAGSPKGRPGRCEGQQPHVLCA